MNERLWEALSALNDEILQETLALSKDAEQAERAAQENPLTALCGGWIQPWEFCEETPGDDIPF